MLKAIENRRILNKREHKFKKPGSLASKSVFASWSLKKGERQSKKSSLLTKKHGGMVFQIYFDIYSVSVPHELSCCSTLTLSLLMKKNIYLLFIGQSDCQNLDICTGSHPCEYTEYSENTTVLMYDIFFILQGTKVYDT
jgi:hypothetical protein